MKRFLPWIILAIAAASIAANWMPPKAAKDDFDFSRFGEIPVLVGGRVKPLDTVARNSLLIIHGKQELRLEGGRRLSAMQWLTDIVVQCSRRRSVSGVCRAKRGRPRLVWLATKRQEIF